MTRHVTAAANTIRLDLAEAAGKPPKRPCPPPDLGRETLLRLPVTRPAAEEEAPDVSRAIGREPEPWEADLITAVRLTERRRERAGLEGLT